MFSSVGCALAPVDGWICNFPGLMMKPCTTGTVCLNTACVEARVDGMFKDDGKLKCIKWNVSTV